MRLSLGWIRYCIERKEKPGEPHCDFCLVNPRIVEYVKINEKTVNSPVYRARDFSQDGTEVSTPYHKRYELAYVLNRKTFDKEVLKLAIKEGTEYMGKTRATGLIRDGEIIKGIRGKRNEEEDVEIKAPIVIGAGWCRI